VKYPGHICRSILLGAVICLQMLAVVQAQDASVDWNGFEPFQIDLSATDPPPFLALSETSSDTPDALPAPASGKPSSPAARPGRSALPETVTSDAEAGQAQRSRMRDDLRRDGEVSLASRDALSGELFSVMKWTITVLVIGVVAVVALKQIRLPGGTAQAPTKMAIVESLQLGRQQVLNLVQAGGERFLVASDPGGIKSVTLLPSWPAMDAEEQTEQDRLRVYSEPADLHDAERLAAG
jgi:hypothetical protein